MTAIFTKSPVGKNEEHYRASCITNVHSVLVTNLLCTFLLQAVRFLYTAVSKTYVQTCFETNYIPLSDFQTFTDTIHSATTFRFAGCDAPVEWISSQNNVKTDMLQVVTLSRLLHSKPWFLEAFINSSIKNAPCNFSNGFNLLKCIHLFAHKTAACWRCLCSSNF